MRIGELYKIEKKESVVSLADMNPEKAAAIKKPGYWPKSSKSRREVSLITSFRKCSLVRKCAWTGIMAMHKLDPLFSYESLVSIRQWTSLPR